MFDDIERSHRGRPGSLAAAVLVFRFVFAVKAPSDMLKARDVMTTQVVSVDPDDSITQALDLMLQHGLSSLPVVDASGDLVGIISEFDLLDLAWDGDSGSEVYQYMTRQVHTVDENDGLGCVTEHFRLFGIRRLPVMRGERVVGIISRHDLLAHLADLRRRQRMPVAA